MASQKGKIGWVTKEMFKFFFTLILVFFLMVPGISLAAPSETLVSATVDVIVAIDTTGSMSGWIRQVRSETASFANELEAEGFDYRLGLMDFKDIRVNGPAEWYGFTKNSTTFNGWVNGLSARGGGDWPESDINAMYNAKNKFNNEGRSTAGRMLILITDAPFIARENGYDIQGIGKLLSDNNIVLNIIGSGANAYGQAHELDGLTSGEYYSTNNLNTAYEGIIDQIQRNSPPEVEESEVVLPPGVDPGSIDTSTELEFSLIGADVDGDVLRYYWEGLSPEEREVFLGDTPTIRVRLTEPGVWEVIGTATDPTGESVSVTHQIAIGNKKPSLSNLRINSTNTTTPTVSWDYTDPEGHAQQKVHMRVKKTDAVVWDSGEINRSIASGVPQGMDYGEDYRIEVRVMDRYDAWSDWIGVSAHINSLPELRPITLVTTPADAVLDQDTVKVNVRVNNEWEQTAGKFRVSLYDDGNLVGQQTVSSLNGGENTSVLFSFQANQPKVHTLKAVVDSGRQVIEGNESNNEMTETIQVLHRVDLIPSLTFLSGSTVPQGGRYSLRVTVKNNGQGEAGASRTDVYQNGIRIVQKSITPLNAGAATTFDIENLSAEQAGKQTFKVVADAANQLAEAREDNNTIESDLQVAAPQEVRDFRFTTTPDGNSVTVHWSDPADAFFDHTELAFEGTSIPLEKDVEQWTFDGLQPETDYTVRIITVNTTGIKSAGITREVTTSKDTVPAGDVQDVRMTSGSQGRTIQLQWVDPDDADYRLAEINLLQNNGEPIREPIQLEKGKENFVFKRIMPSADYLIQWITIDASGNRSVGVKLPFRTAADTIPPEAVNPFGVEADKASGSLQLTWADPTDEGLTEIIISLKEDIEDAEWKEAGQIPAGVEAVVLIPEANHSYVIRAVAVDDQGNRSEPVDIRSTLLFSKPLKPVDVRFNKWGTSQVIQWEEAGNVLPVKYHLYRRTSGEDEPKELKVLPSGTTRFVDRLDLEYGERLDYYVAALDGEGTESELAGPVGPTVSFTDSPILRFVDSSSEMVRLESTVIKKAIEYKLERRESDDWLIIENKTTESDRIDWVDYEVQPGHRYQYRVIAVQDELRAMSIPIFVTVPVSAPSVPSLLEAKQEESGIHLTWLPPESGADAYNLYVQKEVGPILLVASRIDNVKYTDEADRPDGSYIYYVSAWKNGTESDKAMSPSVLRRTIPDPGWGSTEDDPKEQVGDYVFVEQVGESVSVSWKAAEGTPAHYFVYRQESGSLYQKLIAVLTGDRVRFVDSTAKVEESYTYAVQAQYRETYGSKLTAKFEANPIELVPADGISPSAVFDPVRVTATVDDRTVLLTWEVPKAAEEYLIYRKDPITPLRILVGRVSGIKGSLFVDTSAIPGRLYEYEVIARYSGGNSAMVKSNAVSIPLS